MTSQLALLCLALAPAFCIIIFFYAKDKNDREPFGVLLRSFLWGCFSVVPAIILELAIPNLLPNATNFSDPAKSSSIIDVIISTFFIIGFSEEFCKYIFFRYYAYKKPSFNEPYDGIMYGIMVGMGFATIENLMYIFGNDGGGWGMAALRSVTAVPAHATFAVVMGYYVGLAKFSQKNSEAYMMRGLIYAIILHGFYDFFLFQQLTTWLYIGAVISLFIGLRFSIKAIKLHKASPYAIQKEMQNYESPQKPVN